MYNALKKIFNIESSFKGTVKHKIFTIFGIRIKHRVKVSKNLWKFVRNKRPKPLDKSIEAPREKVYLSIVGIFKDEPDIIEWIEYHKLVGVERFYLYDNDSALDYETILKPYIDDKTVIYKKVQGKCMQVPVYRDAIYRYKSETEWLAIIDLDEYIVPVEKNNLKDFLKDYDNYPAIVANWVMFDSNGLKKRDKNKTVIESFTRVYKNYQEPKNKTIKTIVKPKEVRFIQSVHACLYQNNRLAVDENFKSYEGTLYFRTENNSINKIRINHYHCKSREEYLSKIVKGFADRKTTRSFNEENLNFKNTTNDYIILKYLPELKERIREKRQIWIH